MRPKSLDDYLGQEHLVGKGAVLRQAIENNRVPSFILWGPPGVGKTTLARIIAHQLERPFISLSAINSGVILNSASVCFVVVLCSLSFPLKKFKSFSKNFSNILTLF